MSFDTSFSQAYQYTSTSCTYLRGSWPTSRFTSLFTDDFSVTLRLPQYGWFGVISKQWYQRRVREKEKDFIHKTWLDNDRYALVSLDRAKQPVEGNTIDLPKIQEISYFVPLHSPTPESKEEEFDR
eukprot:TRINITY_DN3878_c0_g1_i1.p2 TRINITY_DN3878_c0_g1~~TRINITY_DN3878_c0_g1_i1.p2  ORF type:complete len:126 (+),score=28.58 TRINITY_DN3878_c0_g1_i1:342-719(+)